MLSTVKSMSLHGLQGYLIDVQVDVGPGLPYYEIVGLPDTSVRESKERVRAAIKNSGIEIKSRRIVINLAPADTKKEGSIFDLPIAIGILNATENITIQQKAEFETTILLGELSLDGKLNKINGVLPICVEAKRLGIKRVILPKHNDKEAAIVKELEIIGANDLKQVVNILSGIEKIIKEENNEIDIFKQKYKYDFSEVKGQKNVNRALEIAAAGGHNCILIGSPGSRENNDGKKITINITGYDL